MLDLLPEARETAHPKHPHGTRISVQAFGDFIVGKPFQVSQDNNFPIILRQWLQRLGEENLALVLDQHLARRCACSGEDVAKPFGGVSELLIKRDLVLQVAFLCAAITADFVGEGVRQNLSQPGGQFCFRGAAKLRQGSYRFEHRLLNDVRGIELGAEVALHLNLRQQPEPRLEMPEKLVDRLRLACAAGAQELLHRWSGVQHDHITGCAGAAAAARFVKRFQARLIARPKPDSTIRVPAKPAPATAMRYQSPHM
jgi:hypothetical protein